jgi:ABC-2 type transport system permease protein
MFNLSILKRDIKSSGRLWLLFFVLMLLQLFLALSVYDQRGDSSHVFQFFSTGMLQFFGINGESTGLTEYLSGRLYGFGYPLLAMLYSVWMGNELMAKQIENGMMGWYLTSPNRRRRVASTQVYCLVGGLFFLFFFVTMVGLVCCGIAYPGKLEIGKFLLLNIGCFCLSLAFGGISFLVSCLCNESGRALMLGGGISFLFLILRLLANMGGILELLKYITIVTLFSATDVLEGSPALFWKFPLLAVLGILLSIIGIRLFEHRDLPL